MQQLKALDLRARGKSKIDGQDHLSQSSKRHKVVLRNQNKSMNIENFTTLNFSRSKFSLRETDLENIEFALKSIRFNPHIGDELGPELKTKIKNSEDKSSKFQTYSFGTIDDFHEWRIHFQN